MHECRYTTDGFLEKNRDKLEDDVAEVLIASTDALLAKLFDPSRPSNQVRMRRARSMSYAMPFPTCVDGFD